MQNTAKFLMFHIFVIVQVIEISKSESVSEKSLFYKIPKLQEYN